jgi:hypothetical protein
MKFFVMVVAFAAATFIGCGTGESTTVFREDVEQPMPPPEDAGIDAEVCKVSEQKDEPGCVDGGP